MAVEMTFPWEKPKSEFERYREFMDSHIRVSITVNGYLKTCFSVLDDGTNMNVQFAGVEVKNEGHPRTGERIVNATELVEYILTLSEIKSQ